MTLSIRSRSLPTTLPGRMIHRLFVDAWSWDYGGIEHEGWLPPGSAKPLPTPRATVTVRLEIQPEADGWLLAWELVDDDQCLPDSLARGGDTWHNTLDSALDSAQLHFGVPRTRWVRS